jgi:hypothetical protein
MYEDDAEIVEEGGVWVNKKTAEEMKVVRDKEI